MKFRYNGRTYNFSWDVNKEITNFKKHKTHFKESTEIFRDTQLLSLFDLEHSEQEDRWISLGRTSKAKLLIVIHTFKETSLKDINIRIISAKKPTIKESKKYFEGEK